MEFTPKQLEAIEHECGPVEVMAGPGTGKTRIIVERLARLIEKGIAWKYDVLCLTFTQKDASELRERVQARLGEDAEDLPIYTFHSYGRHLLASERDGADGPFRIYDPEASFRLLQRAMKDLRVHEAAWPPRLVAELIADAKENNIRPEGFLTVPDSANQQTVAAIYARYQELLAEQGGHDFADLIMGSIRLLESRPELLAQLHQQHPFIMVDEWQDGSIGQYRLIRLLTGPRASLFVVGSEAQAVYEWRHASYRKLSERFYADFPGARLIFLEENFRSTRQIVEASRALFLGHRYRDAALTAVRGDGPRVQDVRLPTGQDEAAFVVGEIRRLRDQGGIEWADMAVLFRTNAQSRPFEQECLLQRVPYTLLQGRRLYHQREVRDLLAYLEVASSGSEPHLATIINSPPRGLGPNALRAIKGGSPAVTWEGIFRAMSDGAGRGLRPKAVETLAALYDLLMDFTAHSGDRPADLIAYIFDRSGYRAWAAQQLDCGARMAAVESLKSEASEYDTVEEFLEAVKEKSEADGGAGFGDESGGVALSTIHSVKGLQFRAVFVAGMEEGLLPHSKSAAGGEESERRLAYVAMTRAQDHLYLVSAAARERDGRLVAARPSRYLDLPPEFVERKPV